ncbi:MAG TPA: MarR family transcriptional regulator [Acidimicrobiales bacterium]|nr:MarR family transcriptional regulator [Acidimicrobiales bacterium]
MAPSDWRDDDLIGVWSALLRVHAELVPVLDSELQRAGGIPLGWYDVLLELAAAPGRRMRMTDLGEAVVLSRSRVSRVVDELVRKGYVTRTPNPDDGRSAFAALTPAGYKAFRSAAPIYLNRIRTHLAPRLNAGEAKQLRRLLEKVLSHAGI